MIAHLDAKAQSFTGNLSGNIQVSAIQSLTLTGGAAIPSFQNINQYSTGITMTNYLTIAVKSNVGWALSVQGQNQFFKSMTESGSTNMPIGVLSMKLTTNSNYTTITTNNQSLKTGSRGNETITGNTFVVDMKFNPGFNYKGGIYSVGLLYTLTPL